MNDTKDNQPVAYPATLGNANLGGLTKRTTQNFVINYDWTISPSLFLSAKLGSTQYKTDFTPSDGTNIAVTDYRWMDDGPGYNAWIAADPVNHTYDNNPDLGLGYRRGGAGYYVGQDKTQTTQAKVDLSYFLGTHNMKFGVSQLTSKYTEIAATSGGERVTINAVGTSSSQIIRQFLSTNATVKEIITAVYAQDTWDVGSGVKLMYGFRWEMQDQRDLNDKSFLKFDDFKDYVQPRLGFTWDVNQDGKTKVSGNYAKYFEQIPQRMAIRVYANEQYLRYNYRFSNSTYNNATGAYTFGAAPNTITDYATPFSFDPIAEGTKLPERNEFILGIDHTLASGWTVGVHAKYRELKNPMEDMVFTDSYGNPYDEGPAISLTSTGVPRYGAGAAVIGNPGAFQQWRPNPASMTQHILANGSYFGYAAGYNNYGIYITDYYNPATGLFTVQNTGYEKAGNKFSSVDFTLDKKTERDTFSFSYTWSRLEGNYEGVVSSSNGQADGNITASFDYFPYVGYGLLPLDRTHVVKLFASHRFDFFSGDLNVGVNWTYQSGTPNSLWDDGSTSNGYAPGWDTAHLGYLDYENNTTLSGNPIAVNTQAAYDNPNNWIVTDSNGDPAGPGTQWIGATSDIHAFRDIGFYGNATAANGTQGGAGRSPALNNVDVHVDWSKKLGGKMKLIPSVDIFNLFNTRYATAQLQQATTQGGTPEARYGAATNWQLGRRYRFGVKLQF